MLHRSKRICDARSDQARNRRPHYAHRTSAAIQQVRVGPRASAPASRSGSVNQQWVEFTGDAGCSDPKSLGPRGDRHTERWPILAKRLVRSTTSRGLRAAETAFGCAALNEIETKRWRSVVAQCSSARRWALVSRETWREISSARSFQASERAEVVAALWQRSAAQIDAGELHAYAGAEMRCHRKLHREACRRSAQTITERRVAARRATHEMRCATEGFSRTARSGVKRAFDGAE